MATAHYPQVKGNISVFGGAATLSDFNLLLASNESITASLRITIPALNLNNATATLLYTRATGVYVFSISGQFALLDGAVSITSLTLSTGKNATYLAGNCAGVFSGKSVNVTFNLTKPTGNVAGQTSAALLSSTSVSIPSINVRQLANTLVPSVVDQIPSFALDAVFPRLDLVTMAGGMACVCDKIG